MKTQRENISEMKEAKRIEKRHLMNCRIAGFSYWDGAEAFEKLKIGTPLDLVRRWIWSANRITVSTHMLSPFITGSTSWASSRET